MTARLEAGTGRRVKSCGLPQNAQRTDVPAIASEGMWSGDTRCHTVSCACPIDVADAGAMSLESKPTVQE